MYESEKELKEAVEEDVTSVLKEIFKDAKQPRTKKGTTAKRKMTTARAGKGKAKQEEKVITPELEENLWMIYGRLQHIIEDADDLDFKKLLQETIYLISETLA